MPQAEELVLLKKIRHNFSCFLKTETTFLIKAFRKYFASGVFIYPTHGGETIFWIIFSRKARMSCSLSEFVIYFVVFCLKQDFGMKARI